MRVGAIVAVDVDEIVDKNVDTAHPGTMPQTRISEPAHRLLRRLSRDLGMSSEALLDRALELLERQRTLDAINAGYADLRADRERWVEELAERRIWET